MNTGNTNKTPAHNFTAKTTLHLALCLLIVVSLLGGCSIPKKSTPGPAIKAQHEIPEDQLLDIGIAIFDPGIPQDKKTQQQENVFPEVRKAEARYLAYALRNTFEETSQWGAVRVVPVDSHTTDVLITGKIIVSSGEQLTMELVVRDATGRLWLHKEYTDKAEPEAYDQHGPVIEDPFQALHNTFANDLLEIKNRLEQKNIHTIRTTSELRFAAELSPQAFENHLSEKDQGRYTIKRLPAKDDPMLHRVRKIRERDHMLIDTLDEHYASFYRDMEKPYQDWRRHSFEETMAQRETERSAHQRLLLGAAAVIAGLLGASQNNSVVSTAGTFAVLGGASVFMSGLDKQAQAEIHTEALQELGQSFEAEVEPLVIDVEGKTVTLTGSAEAQYRAWRQLLRRIYAAETGFEFNDIQDSEPPSAGHLDP
ncbi:MAG: hypothetical protein ABFS45_21870 [Pseudomonadota bacterium]